MSSLAWFRDKGGIPRPGAGSGLSQATACRYLGEVIDVLAGQVTRSSSWTTALWLKPGGRGTCSAARSTSGLARSYPKYSDLLRDQFPSRRGPCALASISFASLGMDHVNQPEPCDSASRSWPPRGTDDAFLRPAWQCFLRGD